jgi:3-hydroxymyristoyl/3-hydroxydecanoyl-(acyl carrier protein) dehydratase
LLENLFKILDFNDKESEKEILILLSNKEHILFKSHFPNNEILAGFLQIDIIANILNHQIKKIKKAKFISVIKPNDKLIYFVNSKDNILHNIVIKNLSKNKISEFSYEI